MINPAVFINFVVFEKNSKSEYKMTEIQNYEEFGFFVSLIGRLDI